MANVRTAVALVALVCAVVSAEDAALFNKTNGRAGKVFSLFNVVSFKNTGCRSTSAASSNGATSTYRNGTCYTTSECAAKGGTAAGNCAAGFGVCCVFLVSASGATITQNCTYVRNPGYPSAYSGTSTVSYTVEKCSSAVCFLRLDFESFTLRGTGLTTELNGGSCTDTFTVSRQPNKMNIPVICGQNSGQHMYVDLGNQGSDSTTLTFAFSGTSSNRQWEIKVTQVPCGANYAPPESCLQYYTGLTGRFTTYNFLATNDNQLASQDYSACIRQEEGYCCVQYAVCPDPNSFTLSSGIGALAMMAMTDTTCTLDYIGITADTCNQGTQGAVTNQYCGALFTTVNKNPSATSASMPICDCTAPFSIDVFTDTLTDKGDTTTVNTKQDRGVCIMWTMIPCNS